MQRLNLRPMDIGDILDTSFRIYRNRFVTIMAISLIVYLPYTAVSTYVAPNRPAIESSTGGGIEQVNYFLLTMVFFLLINPLCQGALVSNISATYLGQEETALESYRKAFRRFFSLIFAPVLYAMFIFAGFLFFIVPGFLFTLWGMLIIPCVVLERKNPYDALVRSRQLMKNNLFKGFKLITCTGFIVFAFSFQIEVMRALSELFDPRFLFVANALQVLMQALCLPIQNIPAALFYFDLRVRKEALDLHILANDLPEIEADS